MIAKAINEAQTHVAINLDGWTSMGRTSDVFALTPAPVQVSSFLIMIVLLSCMIILIYMSLICLLVNLHAFHCFIGAVYGLPWNAWSIICAIFGC